MTGLPLSRALTKRHASGAAALAVGACLFAATVGPANAEKVGVAAAVNPDAFSSLSQTPNKQLNIGKSIFYNERINTTTSGLVQVLLVDGSTFTVGPNSNLVIDKFVYDPRKKTGELVATFSKGTMRFIGGKLSKNAGGVKVKTPSGALAIRGGMFQGNANRGIYSFLYGHSLTFRGRNGQTQTVYQPGYTLDLSRGSANVRPTTAEDTNAFMKALTSPATNTAGAAPANQETSNPPPELAETLSLQDLISDATATQINDSLAKEEEKDKPTPPTETSTPTTTNNDPPPPPQIDARVIRAGDGLVPDDFVWTFSIVNDRLVADVPAVDTEGCDDSNCEILPTLASTRPALQFDFPETVENCLDGLCAINDAKVTVNGETFEFAGHAVLKNDFFAYHVAEQGLGKDEQVLLRNAVLVFGGKKRNFEASSGKVYIFALTSDVIQQTVPFASANSTPDEAIGFVSPLIAKEQNTGGADDQSRPVWLQTSFALGTGESNGQSFVNVALGEWSPEDGLTGERRGGSDTNRDNYSFSGDIASLAGPDGGHFLGADDENPNAVLTLGGAGTENPRRDTPLNNRLFPGDGLDGLNTQSVQGGQDQNNLPGPQIDPHSGSTYHIATGTETLEEGVEATSGEFSGYAAGFSQRAGTGDVRSLVNKSPHEVTLNLDAPTNTMTASINVGGANLLQNPKYSFQFGGEGNSALINDDIFAAFEKPGASQIVETTTEWRTETVTKTFGKGKWWEYTVTYERPKLVDVDHSYTPETEGYLVSADAIGANEVLFEGQTVEGPDGPVQKQAFCQDCDYIKWGAWGTRSSYEDYEGRPVTEDTHLGWWIAGDDVPATDIDKLEALGATARYSGDAIGTVAKLRDGIWNQSVATGDFDVTWKFAKRRGDFTISNFDGKTFGGRLRNPAGTSTFATKATDLRNIKNGIVTQANGKFVGARSGKAPAGVIGNFQANKLNGRWKANGIYGGTR